MFPSRVPQILVIGSVYNNHEGSERPHASLSLRQRLQESEPALRTRSLLVAAVVCKDARLSRKGKQTTTCALGHRLSSWWGSRRSL